MTDKKLKTKKTTKTNTKTNECVKNNNVSSFGMDRDFDFNKIESSFNIELLSNNADNIEFIVDGIDAPFANALRRTIIDEVQTMAIHKAAIYQNTSVINDEILSHRFGLLPIQADPDMFEEWIEGNELNEKNCLKFLLNVKCLRKPEHKDTPDLPIKNLINHHVLAENICWIPLGNQAQRFARNPPKVLYPKSLIAKLAENQEIEVELYCVKGIGMEHTKWSPVCSAYYRLLPSVKLSSKISKDDILKIKNICPSHVFDIEDIKNEKRLIVKNESACTNCRACQFLPVEDEMVRISKQNKKYHFTVESVGQMKAQEIVLRAVTVLKNKGGLYMKDIM